MKINIQSLGFSPKQTLLDSVNQKMEKLFSLYDGIVAMDVRLNNGKEIKEIEVSAHIVGRKTIVVKKDNEESFETVLDEVYESLRKTIRRYKEKMRDRGGE